MPHTQIELDALGIKDRPDVSYIQANTDLMLCNMFPGKLPSDFDNVDYGRIMRMLQVKRIDTVEQQREAWLNGKLTTKDLDPSTLKAMSDHDQLYTEWQNKKR